MAKKNELDFHLPSADDLFSTQEEREDAKLKRIYEISLDEIDPFPRNFHQSGYRNGYCKRRRRDAVNSERTGMG